MNRLDDLLERNRGWADRISREDPGFFERLSKQQAPKYLWIGCSDSRVPANQVVDLAPGEVFVHRNIANVVVHTDLNPTQIVPVGPDLRNWLTPHHREQLGGRPFGDGTPPGPVADGEKVPAENWVPLD